MSTGVGNYISTCLLYPMCKSKHRKKDKNRPRIGTFQPRIDLSGTRKQYDRIKKFSRLSRSRKSPYPNLKSCKYWTDLGLLLGLGWVALRVVPFFHPNLNLVHPKILNFLKPLPFPSLIPFPPSALPLFPDYLPHLKLPLYHPIHNLL